ncbi:MAG: DUF3570 domain-containing protein [Proteobacteria bacterium]|nr:MAG: DUF3570 domain-containing protein [Pseudomonadota bacterium]QKK12104.1 MAG: DUF3570 domain-containing protein [Pseudomonadota bacterium]
MVLLAVGCGAQAAVLPEERADLLYHSYDGGGVEVTGPSFLVRKNVGQSWSVFGNHYVDSVSSASIDVITTASPYQDDRTETSFGVDYLRGRTILSLATTTSDESDYSAKSLSFGISQDMFGDLTTVTMGYTAGDDVVGNVTDSSFSANIDRQQYRLSVTQVLSKSLIVSAALETITDEGYLNNPYRSVRYVDGGSATGYSYEAEVYPRTRTSDALALRARYFLPYRAALFGEYRQYRDTWGIDADTYEIGYVHPLGERWIIEARLRHYNQNAADFYSDLYPFQGAQNFLARDKELSTFSSRTFGLTIGYEFAKSGWGFIDRASLNLSFDRIQFSYDDFRDLTQTGYAVGNEPLYEFDADVLQIFISIWY